MSVNRGEKLDLTTSILLNEREIYHYLSLKRITLIKNFNILLTIIT